MSPSQLMLDAKAFDPASVTQETHESNDKLIDIMRGAPRWYEVGAERYRRMRAAGETPLPAAVYLDAAEAYQIPSRDAGRMIPARVIRPQIKVPLQGVFLHLHGGGWVLQDEKSQDAYLQDIATMNSLLAISIGYRLAPEHPFPAGPDDCHDAVAWLVRNATSQFGAPLSFVGGESAGGHLAMLVALHLLRSPDPALSSFTFRGLLLHFGCYDLSFTPSVYTFQPRSATGDPECLVLDRDIMSHYIEACLPGSSSAELRRPSVSPLYTDLEQLRDRLPPALFTCGTSDILLDDTLFMATKWQQAGAAATVRIYPGAPHGYIFFPPDTPGTFSRAALDEVRAFVTATLA